MLGNWSPISLWQRWLRFGLFWICKCFNVAVGRKSGSEIELFVRFRSQIWQIYLQILFIFCGKRKKERKIRRRQSERSCLNWMDATCRAPIELRFKFALDDHLFAPMYNQCWCWVCEKSWAIDLLSLFCNIHWELNCQRSSDSSIEL